MIHEIKTLPRYFEAVISGSKPFEVRKDDRGFCVGDLVRLREWDDRYTGREITKRITYALRDFPGIAPGYVVLGLGEP